MVFSSPSFLFMFLPVFIIVYYLTPPNNAARNFTALLGSVVFYAWGEPIYVFLLLGSTIIHYLTACIVAPSETRPQSRRKALLIAVIILDVAGLVYFKYANFLLDQLKPAFVTLSITLPDTHIGLLLGISFVTFHQISFLVDIYCGRAAAPRNYIDCALYIFLFQQLIAGPIVRFHDIGGQIAGRQHSLEKFQSGMLVFSIGLAKKVLIADPVGAMADHVFAIPAGDLPISYAWIGIIAYTMQIYFDFSGYSEMAIGLGRLIGLEFPRNFNHPYVSRSITEFWQRWHISLSNWMRLYLYIPLGGNRVGPVRMYSNLWIVFLISGFWHGASWNFVVWGAYYGFFLTAEKFCVNNGLALNLPDWMRHGLTFLLVVVAWVFFRAPTLDYAFTFLGVMFGLAPSSGAPVTPWGWLFTGRGLTTLALATLISTQPWREWIAAAWSRGTSILGQGRTVLTGGPAVATARFCATTLLLAGSACALTSGGYTPFLYFRF